ncbi:MAG: dihydroneopterin triphosphate diphosphatase [Gammaproteobacteria bacterium]|nr:dihydroneopterin triphosphate diphosphatase [Gammaproteobacteria bacterium]
MDFKRPESVLVVVHVEAKRFLLLRRIVPAGFWQSVTGSLRWDEQDPEVAAWRELREETGLDGVGVLRDWQQTREFAIDPRWRGKFPPGTTHNIEHCFSLELPAEREIFINPREHDRWRWVGADAALGQVASWTNREGIRSVIRGARL